MVIGPWAERLWPMSRGARILSAEVAVVHWSRSLPAQGLVVVAMVVTACGGATASPTPTPSPVATMEAVPPTAGATPTMQPTPSAAATVRPSTDPLAAKLLAAVERVSSAFAEIQGAGKDDWPAQRAALTRVADIYDAFAREVEALDGATRNLRSNHSAALIGYSKQIAIVLRQIAAAEIGLTERQMEVLRLMMEGKSNKAICRTLDIAEPTVKNHVTAILRALKAANRTEAVVAAGALGLGPREAG